MGGGMVRIPRRRQADSKSGYQNFTLGLGRTPPKLCACPSARKSRHSSRFIGALDR